MSDVKSAEALLWNEVTCSVWWGVNHAGRIMAEIHRSVPGVPFYEIVRGNGTGEKYISLEAAQKRVEEGADPLAEARAALAEAAMELSGSPTFADPRISYEERQLTAGWAAEWIKRPAVVAALQEREGGQ